MFVISTSEVVMLFMGSGSLIQESEKSCSVLKAEHCPPCKSLCSQSMKLPYKLLLLLLKAGD